MRIFKGDAVSEIKQKAPSEFYHTVNVREAESIGFSIPDSVKGGATKVIK